MTGVAQSNRTHDYSAPAECPARAWFEAELTSRLTGHGETSRDLNVLVQEQANGFVGWVQVAGASDSERREVRHTSCEQLVRALALIGALLIDPATRDDAVATTMEEAPVVAQPAPKPRSHSVTWTPRTLSQDSAPSEPWRFAQGPHIGLALQALIAKDVTPGLRGGYRALAAHGRFQTELAVDIGYAHSGTQEVAGLGSAEFTFFAVRPELCQAVRGRWPVTLGLCAWLDIGTLQGHGQLIGKAPLSRRAGWLSPGLSGKAEWRPLGPLTLALSAGAFYPLERPEFHFRDDAGEHTILRVPKKPGFSGDLSLGLLFW